MKRITAVLLSFLLIAPISAEDKLTVVHEIQEPPGNITITPLGEILISLHQFYEHPVRVANILADDDVRPFPRPSLSIFTEELPLSFDSILGIQSDPTGIVWMLDNGMRENSTPKLIGWDTKTDGLHQVIWLPEPISRPDSFLNDLAVDFTRNHIYIADPAGGDNAALIVVNLKTGQARRVLEGNRSVVPSPDAPDLIIDGNPVEILLDNGETIRPRIGVNPIALDATNGYLYYGAMHGTHLYRIPSPALTDYTWTDDELALMIEQYAERPISDGISIDLQGNIYITDLANNAIGVINTDREYQIYVQSELLSWPDALSFGPDGKLYTVSNQLHRTARLNVGNDESTTPYRIFRIEPLAPGIVGR